MNKELINFNENGFNDRKRKIDAMAIKLNDLMAAFYELSLNAEKGIDINELLYNDSYINM